MKREDDENKKPLDVDDPNTGIDNDADPLDDNEEDEQDEDEDTDEDIDDPEDDDE